MEREREPVVAYSPLGRHPLPMQPMGVIRSGAVPVTTKEHKNFSKAVLCELLVDNLMLFVFWGVCISMVYMHWAWWIPTGVIAFLQLFALSCLFTSCCAGRRIELYKFFKSYGKIRLGLICLALIIMIALLVLAIICWAVAPSKDNEIDSMMWNGFGFLYLMRTGIVLIIGLWFLLTAKSFFHQLKKFLPQTDYQG